MQHRFSVVTALKAFNVIRQRGEKGAEGYVLDGIAARAEYDGYTVSMTDGRVTLYIYFHNKHKFDFERSDDLDSFMETLKRLSE
ncbi:DUF3081 family protein [Marinobacterium sedimentorum]|uniref:DUF3081 family protein n=1 Tax=Marinobacterium sedimentorum TaxID=2927804 RepID=UPI0020C6A65C|nr:DUF3081 family protein [Marinobacterium sedimentorum]MCP8688102.1 DUF3081 domain-containing protein [Marinobacterium sedimentorum]